MTPTWGQLPANLCVCVCVCVCVLKGVRSSDNSLVSSANSCMLSLGTLGGGGGVPGWLGVMGEGEEGSILVPAEVLGGGDTQCGCIMAAGAK